MGIEQMDAESSNAGMGKEYRRRYIDAIGIVDGIGQHFKGDGIKAVIGKAFGQFHPPGIDFENGRCDLSDVRFHLKLQVGTVSGRQRIDDADRRRFENRFSRVSVQKPMDAP